MIGEEEYPTGYPDFRIGASQVETKNSTAAPAYSPLADTITIPAFDETLTTKDLIQHAFDNYGRQLSRLALLLTCDFDNADRVLTGMFGNMQRNYLKGPVRKVSDFLVRDAVRWSRQITQGNFSNIEPSGIWQNIPAYDPEHPIYHQLDLLRNLLPWEREAVSLRHYADLSESEAAIAMGISRHSFFNWYKSGIAKLGAAYEREASSS